MGDMADYYIEQGLDQGWFWSNPRPGPNARRKPRAPACRLCGESRVHWRLFDGEYKLADDQRQHPGNCYVQHCCPTSADGFGDVPDA